MADDKPIIVIKKKGGHGGHHGGAWKVAYADFVTAMMAFFLVMWLVNTAESPTKENIASYFRNPGVFRDGSGSPLATGTSGMIHEAMNPVYHEDEGYLPGQGGDILYDEATREILEGLSDEEKRLFLEKREKLEQLLIEEELKKIEGLAQELQESIITSPELEHLMGSVDIQIRSDGLYIEIMDTEESSMFSLGGSTILPEARQAFLEISKVLAPLPNNIDIFGHTDSRPFVSRQNAYSNWELSAERANAARRLLERDGNISPERITSVVGRADRELKTPDEPDSASNRRISLLVRYNMEGLMDAVDPSKILDFEDLENVSIEKERRAADQPAVSKPAADDEQKQTPEPEFTIPGSPVIGPPDLFTGF